MKSAVTLKTLPAWLQNPALRAVMDALGDGNALLVGGCVRAAVLAEPTADIDIATVWVPQDVTQRLTAAGIRTIPTGVEHGTVTAIIDKTPFEITTLRRDVDTDGRHATVVFTTDWAEDAQRRDFTINTLLMDLKGQIYDPTGQGLADLKAGIVRFVGDPDQRIAEDYLRILRFFRFHARYGKGRPNIEGLKASLRASQELSRLSRERVTQEFEKMLPAKGAGAVLEAMREYEILPGIVPVGFNQKTYAFLQELVRTDLPGTDKKLLFAYSVWENEADKLTDKLEKIFVLSNDLKKYLIHNIQYLNQRTEFIDKNIYIFGRDITLSGETLFNIFKGEAPDLDALKAQLEFIAGRPVPALPVNGNDVAQLMGITQGKELGKILRKLEGWWLDGNLKANRRACLDYIRDNAQKPTD